MNSFINLLLSPVERESERERRRERKKRKIRIFKKQLLLCVSLKN
jgi:hypothetical protein